MRKIIFLFLFIITAAFIAAEDSEPAILARGPVEHFGIEFLGVNAIPAQYGEYKYRGDQIIVYYTTEKIFLSGIWTPAGCNISGMMINDQKTDSTEISYTDKKGWTVIMSFKKDVQYICDFVSAYQSRQNYFLNIAKDKTVFSFPAILEF